VNAQPGLLGDTTERDYSTKLRRFNAFAAPELRTAIARLELRPGMRVLDAGCGTGEALNWLLEQVKPGGEVVGIDLAAAHIAAARATAPEATLLQADLLAAPVAPGSFDLVWSVNTINHLNDPVAGLRTLARLLRPNGRLVLGQGGLLPEMFFAWDSRLERLANEAVRQYYRDRYGLTEQDLTGLRAVVGQMRQAHLQSVSVRSVLIERFAPLDPASEAYITQTLFRDTWGARLQPYMPREDYQRLCQLTDPQNPQFALRRTDFHFLQTLTMVTGYQRD
jgi:SAM-dependent methyltransferase